MKYSVIILLEEKNKDFAEFVRMLHEIFSARPDPFEILIMANGLEGFLKDELEKLSNIDSQLKALGLNKKTSQAVCFKSAVKESQGGIIVVCGSYQQITKDSFTKLLDSYDSNTDILSPWRQHRVDPSFNQFQSKLFNFFVKLVTKSDVHDLSCTVKVFRREVLEEIKLYGNMYRFLPIVAAKKGFKNKEIKCGHFQEHGPTGLYNLSEYLSRFIDIFTLYFNTRFTKKPLRFFSFVGFVFLFVGVITTSILFVQRFFMDIAIGNRPALFVSLFILIFGALVSGIGLLGEIIVFIHGRHRKEYIVEEII